MANIDKIQYHGTLYTIADTIVRRQLNNEVSGMTNDIEQISRTVNSLSESASEAVYDWRIENNILYLLDQKGNTVGEGGISGIGGGGGGGGGGGAYNDAVFRVTNKTGWIQKAVAVGRNCNPVITWSSIEDEMPTGPGTLKIELSGQIKKTENIQQGDVEIQLTPYVSLGMNEFVVTIQDSYENKRIMRFKVDVVQIGLSTTFDDTKAYFDTIYYTYRPLGLVRKTMHFLLDGEEVDTIIKNDEEPEDYMITGLTHGVHKFEVYFTCSIEGSEAESDHLKHEIIYVSGNRPIIASSFDSYTVRQYQSIMLPFIIYSSESLMTPYSITLDNEVVETGNADRNEKTFSCRCDNVGTMVVEITAGSGANTSSRTFEITVEESSYEISAVTQNLDLYLSSVGRSNSATNKSQWVYEGISCEFRNFNFVSDGWQRVGNSTVLRIGGDARLYIPYLLFQNDFKTNGKTIEIEFETRDVLNYDATILSCWSGNRGLTMTPQSIRLKPKIQDTTLQYKENEHVRVAFVIENTEGTHLIIPYINGIASGAIKYETDKEDFTQESAVGITIGSNDATIDIYCIRVYNTALNRRQMVMNRIADMQDIDEKLTTYQRNDLYDRSGKIVISQLPTDLPYMEIIAQRLPQFKGDKRKCDGRYVDRQNPERSFTWTNADIDVQGTSSQFYARKNYKVKFKKATITLADGTTSTKYALREGMMPLGTFCFKADVASSEGCNNVELVRLYDMSCPYRTPAQVENPLVHQGIDGIPMVIFWNNTLQSSFLGKYNFNVDKSAEEFFGFEDGDESWETKIHTSNRVLFKSNDFDSWGVDEDGIAIKAWLNDFEARYPDIDVEDGGPYQDCSQLKEFLDWIITTDPDTATNNALPASVTYTTMIAQHIATEDYETGAITYREVLMPQEVTFTNDTADYRIAKFRDEIGNYVEVQDLQFYYLFTELFLMMDNRAKNMFISFMGTRIQQQEEPGE